MCDYNLQEVLRNLESHRQTFQQIHKDRSVNGVPVPSEQLQDMAERQDLLLWIWHYMLNIKWYVLIVLFVCMFYKNPAVLFVMPMINLQVQFCVNIITFPLDKTWILGNEVSTDGIPPVSWDKA